MANESFEPKLPFYGKDGKVWDERIGKAMAEAEFSPKLSARVVSLSALRGRPDPAAGERAGDDFYQTYGIEIERSDVPPRVMTAFEHATQAHMRRSIEEGAEFRKIGSDEKAEYLILFDFKKNPAGWVCFSLRMTSAGDIRGFDVVTFRD